MFSIPTGMRVFVILYQKKEAMKLSLKKHKKWY
jgi:hypothetical protein